LLHEPGNSKIKEHPLVKIYNTPSHRAQLGETIAQTGCASALIDTSDGFLGDLGHICEESRVGAELFKERLPISEHLREAALRLRRDPYDFFLGDSDDYELIITCRSQDVPRIRSAVSQCCPVVVTEVGRITGKAGEIFLLLADGTKRPVKPSGWDHFRKSEGKK
jgi:thiamine-monophosphate kinase